MGGGGGKKRRVSGAAPEKGEGLEKSGRGGKNGRVEKMPGSEGGDEQREGRQGEGSGGERGDVGGAGDGVLPAQSEPAPAVPSEALPLAGSEAAAEEIVAAEGGLEAGSAGDMRRPAGLSIDVRGLNVPRAGVGMRVVSPRVRLTLPPQGWPPLAWFEGGCSIWGQEYGVGPW